MTALVACETLLLVVLVVLVAGLLRSHAEILRRLGPPDDEDGAEAPVLRHSAPARSADQLAAPDVAGATLAGDSAKVSLAPGSPPTLLAFLTSGCTSCAGFWEAFGSGGLDELPRDVRVEASWGHWLASLLRDAVADARMAEATTEGGGRSGERRAAR